MIPGKGGRSVRWGRKERGDKGVGQQTQTAKKKWSVRWLIAVWELGSSRAPWAPFVRGRGTEQVGSTARARSKQPVWAVRTGICVFCWIRPISLHAFAIPNVTHASVSISFPRISSAVAPAMANIRTKPKSEPLFSNDIHAGDTACQVQRSETACGVSVCLSSMAHAILFA